MGRIRALFRFVIAINAILSFTACGSTPASTPPPPNEARGVYVVGYAVTTITAVILSDGRFFIPFGGINVLKGFAVGQGTASSGTFTGSYRFFGNPKYTSGTLNATYSSNGVLTGALSEDPTNLTVTGHATLTSIYNPDTPPTLADFKGHWAGLVLGNEPFYVDITSSGTIQSASWAPNTTCTFSGTLSPDAAANYYHVNVTSAASVCNFPANATAIAVLVKTTQPDGVLWPQCLMFFTSPQGATVLKASWDPNNLSPLP